MNKKLTKEELEEAVKNSYSMMGVLRYLKFSLNGSSQAYIKSKILFYNIDYSHFTGQGHNKNKVSIKKQNWQEILKNRPDMDRREASYKLRRALIESGREYKCESCGIQNYNNKEITLDVDHIDGNWKNHNKENLRFLCPNCHSQTDNFRKKKNILDNRCLECDKKIWKTSKRCMQCSKQVLNRREIQNLSMNASKES